MEDAVGVGNESMNALPTQLVKLLQSRLGLRSIHHSMCMSNSLSISIPVDALRTTMQSGKQHSIAATTYAHYSILMKTCRQIDHQWPESLMNIIRLAEQSSPIRQIYSWFFFCRAMLCKGGLCRQAMSVCLCVRLSVTFVNSVKTNKYIFKLLSASRSPTILVFPYQTGW